MLNRRRIIANKIYDYLLALPSFSYIAYVEMGNDKGIDSTVVNILDTPIDFVSQQVCKYIDKV